MEVGWCNANRRKNMSTDTNQEVAFLEKLLSLKQRAKELCGSAITGEESADLPIPVAIEFWEQVIAFEETPEVTLFDELQRAGVTLPSPDDLNDGQLRLKLWEVVYKLRDIRVFLESTDHLSDRELYDLMWRELLKDRVRLFPETICHLDVIGAMSERDQEIYLTYYADEDCRQFWKIQSPEYDLPPTQKPPYDRDRLLPKPDEDPD